MTPNAGPELRLEAGARHERTLEAVSSRPWLGGSGFPSTLLQPAQMKLGRFSLLRRTVRLDPTPDGDTQTPEIRNTV